MAEQVETPQKSWDFETDPDNPQPNVWPECSACKAPYVYRWAMRLSAPSGFFWMRDCKHKTAGAVLMTKDGPLE